MRRFIKEENGEFAIDAIFGITFFMISLIAIMFMAVIIRVQSNIQYALGQTAKEISGYYYLVDKLGLASATAGTNNENTGVDNTIQSVIDFSGSAKNVATQAGQTVQSIKENTDIEKMDFQDYVDFYSDEGGIKNDTEELKKAIKAAKEDADKVGATLKTLASDPKGQAKQVLTVFAKTAANRAVNYYIAPFVCEALMPKYLTSGNYDTIDEYYEAIGISNVNFQGTQFLTDRRSIKIQITYDLDLEKYTLGFVKNTITFRQTASTAAWVRPDGKNLVALKMSELGY